MTDAFFTRPILNSPYGCPTRHWELDDDGQPINRILEKRRQADLVSLASKVGCVDLLQPVAQRDSL